MVLSEAPEEIPSQSSIQVEETVKGRDWCKAFISEDVIVLTLKYQDLLKLLTMRSLNPNSCFAFSLSRKD